MNNQIELAEKRLDKLKLAYEKAKDSKLDKFKFENNFLLTSYAKYLIEHTENEIEHAKDKPWFK